MVHVDTVGPDDLHVSCRNPGKISRRKLKSQGIQLGDHLATFPKKWCVLNS